MSGNSRLVLEPLEERIVMDTYTVTRFSDVGIGRGLRGDLRYCITHANAIPGADQINIERTGTVNLSSALPDLSTDLAIVGPGADQLTVRRHSGGEYRIFTIPAGATVQILNLTVSGGVQSQFGGASTWGGGIRNSGILGLAGVTVRDNHVVDSGAIGKRGGGISNEGTMHISDSTIAFNTTSAMSGSGTWEQTLGGGIYNHTGASLTIVNSTIAGNSAIVTGSANLNRARGGGIHHEGTLLEILNSTISTNTASAAVAEGSGVFGATFIENTIVSGNIGGSGNVFGGFSGGSNFIDGDAMLGPLDDNGGPTLTMQLLPGSPAIDAGDNTNAPEFDQRGPGFPRIVNGTIDIGAFEVQPTRAPRHRDFLAFLITADSGRDEQESIR